MGISRSSTIVIVYLIVTTEMTPRNALALVQSKRAIVRPNRGFMFQLQEYYLKCSSSLQAELGDEPPNKDSRSSGNVKGRQGLAAKAAAKGYARYALTTVTSLSQYISQCSPEGQEYWKFEDRLF